MNRFKNSDDIKEITLSQLLEEDKSYQNSHTQHNLAEKDYINLNLSQEQRDVVDRLLSCTDENNMDYSSLSYLAELFDSSKLFKTLRFPSPAVRSKQTFEDFYNGNLIPVEKPFESPSTLKIWEDLSTLSEDFASRLSPVQAVAFQTMRDKHLEGVTMSSEDSFFLGFQTGSKLLIDILY